MSQFRVLEVENIGRNVRSRKMGVIAKNAEGKSRECLRLLENGIVQKAKRVKLDVTPPQAIFPDENSEQKQSTLQQNLKEIEQSKSSVVTLSTDTQLLPNPSSLLIWEYKQNIWDYLRELELTHPAPKPRYMRKQADLNWNARSIVVDWLASVADAYNMCNETLHLSVNYVDRFLSHYAVVKSKFQLVAASAMLLAEKMEEIYPIDVKEWSYLTAKLFTPRQVIKMERLMVKVLGFKMQPPTMVNFIQHFCHDHNLDDKTTCLAMYISELVLLEGAHYLNHKPSKLAAGCIALARYTLSEKKPWPKTFQTRSGYNLKQLSPIVFRQQQSLIDSPHKEQQEIQSKYKSEKYHRVALLKPRNLTMDLLDDDED